MNPFILKKLHSRRIWKRIFYERLTEPLHLNLLSVFALIFGSYRSKIAFDLIIRPHHAYGLLKAADRAKQCGFDQVSIIEFGVASGAGLLNMDKIAARIQQITGVAFKIYGFDSGSGMPPAKDFRDHPDIYQEGDFPMDYKKLTAKLSSNTILKIGNISDTIPDFINKLPNNQPIGFISIDVDYYHSTKDVLTVLNGATEKYLSIVEIYLDDIELEQHNIFCGELLAIREFNEENKCRKIEHHSFLENNRILKRANWIKHMFQLHVLDNPERFYINKKRATNSLSNPYL